MRKKEQFFFWLLIALTGLFLFASYFHTETTIEPEDDCPICIFERNVVAVSQLYFIFVMVLFICFFEFFISDYRLKTVIYFYHFNSRAPPAV
jgi:disulfide bond formation protein DsbB